MNNYYIYQHVDPSTKEVVYVGHGKGHRAWVCPNDGSVHRSKEHGQWMTKLMDSGYVPSDWVVIISKAITKEQAAKEERGLIVNTSPKYNKLSNPLHWTKGRSVNKEQVSFMKNLRSMGFTHKQIAILVGGDENKAMTVWRQEQYVV